MAFGGTRYVLIISIDGVWHILVFSQYLVKSRWEVTYISPLEQYPDQPILPIHSRQSLGWAEYHDAVVHLDSSTISPERQDQAVDETLMASQISWSMSKLRAKLIEIQIVIHVHIFHCTIQCMHRTANRSIH